MSDPPTASEQAPHHSDRKRSDISETKSKAGETKSDVAATEPKAAATKTTVAEKKTEAETTAARGEGSRLKGNGLFEEAEPQSLGRYELVEKLGHGGMANVYLARATGPAGFRKWVAIKRIHPHLAEERGFVDMFLDEARIAASLQHPNVAHVFDLGTANNTYFIAMEYLHGEHLGALMRRTVEQARRSNGTPHLDYELAAFIMIEAAEGLHHAHEAKDDSGEKLGLVHRDISPQNIFLTFDGAVKLTDFGIAKARGRLTHTATGQLKGKAAYMAPEQALGQETDRRSDIFAMGVVLWELTCGRRLFRSQSDAQTLMRITSGTVPRPSSVDPDFPPALEAIILKALSLNPDDRHENALSFANALREFVTEDRRSEELRTLMHLLFVDAIERKDALLRSQNALRLPPTADAAPPESEPQHEESVQLSEPPPENSARLSGPTASAPPVVPAGRAIWMSPLFLLALVTLLVMGAVGFWAMPARATRAHFETAPSGALVFLDDSPQNARTPLTTDVPPGRHHLRIVLAGHASIETEIVFEQGQDTHLRYVLNADLEPAVPVQVQGVETVDGDATSPPDNDTATPNRPTAHMTERPSSRAIRATPRDDRPRTTDRPRMADRLGAARMEPVATEEEPDGRLTIVSLPWASVSIDGQRATQTPLRNVRLAAGAHTLRYRVQGEGAERSLSVRVQAGAHRTVSLRTN